MRTTQLFFTLALTSAAAVAHAQVPYVATQFAGNFQPLQGGTPVSFGFSTDDGAEIVPIGFSFPYYGETYTHINVGVNGVFSFAAACNGIGACGLFETCGASNVCERTGQPTSSSGPLPTSDEPNAAVAVFWDDLIIDGNNAPTTQVLTQVMGTTPNRIFAVEWREIRHYPNGGPGVSRMNLQARLHETTGIITLHYGAYTPGSNDGVWSGVIGAENGAGTEGLSPLACSASMNQCSSSDLMGLSNMVIQIGPLDEPELVGTVVPPTGGNPGEMIDIAVRVQNIGTRTATSAFTADVYFSDDNMIDPMTDTLLGSVNFGMLASTMAQTSTLSTTVPAGAMPGYYFVGAVIDPNDDVDEAVEANNVIVQSGSFLVGAEISVAMDPVVVAPPSQVSTLTFRILNAGSALPSVGWDLYLSTNQTRDASDTLLASGTSAAPAQPEITVTATASLPMMIMPGDYYLIAVVDPDALVAEADEMNNEAVSASFLVGAELSIDIDPPQTSGPGEVSPVDIQLRSRGWEVGEVAWTIYISVDQMLDVTDPVVATGTTTIGRQRDVDLTIMAPIPTTIVPVDHYFIAVVDPLNAIAETDENNNETIAQRATRMIGPDIVAAQVTGGQRLFPGDDYVVTAIIRNDGGATANNFFYSFYLSNNPLITITDRLLADIGPVTLGPGEEIRVQHTLTTSTALPPGMYHLGLIADSTSQVLEENEANNITRLQTYQVEVRQPAPDFSVLDIVTPPAAAAGETLRLHRTIENNGNAAGDLEYTVYLSLDAILDPGLDTPLGSFSAMVAVAAVDDGANSVRVPADIAAAVYYVIYALDPDNLVDELDESNNVRASRNTLVVERAELGILTTMLPLATLGVPYDVRLAAVGGAGALTWSVSGGALPTGITIDGAAGRLAGTPTVEGRYEVQLTVDDGGLSASRDFLIVVSGPTIGLNVVTRALPPAWIGRPYRYRMTALGGVQPYSWTAIGMLPQGVTLTSDGELAGTPNLAANGVIEFQVTDSTGASDSRRIAVRVIGADDAVRFSTDVLRDGAVGQMYDEQLHALFGVSPYTYSVAGGELPAGLSLAADTIIGVPSSVGEFTFSMRVTDARGDFDVNSFVVRINADEKLRFVTNGLPAATLGKPYLDEAGQAVTLKAISPGGNATIRYAVVAGALPDGMTLEQGGLLMGTPTKAGVFDLMIEARDAQEQSDLAAFGLLVMDPAEGTNTATTTADPGGCNCQTNRTSSGAPWGALVLIVFAGLLALPRASRKLACATGLAVLVLSSASTANAQIPYFVNDFSAPYVERMGCTSLTFTSTDDGSASINLPFDFRFYGTDFGNATVSTNGYLTFGSSGTDFTNEAIPSGGTPNDLIAVFWDDLNQPTGSWCVEGTAPDRVVIVQWKDVRHFGSSLDRINMQLWLFEGPAGRLQLRYGPMSGLGNSWSGTVGIEDGNGSMGETFWSCNANCGSSDLSAAEDHVWEAIQDAGTDVIAGAVTVPNRGFVGTPFDVEVSIQSLHMNPLGPFDYRVHLVAPGDVTPNNPIFTSSTAITLSAYETRRLTVPVAVPVTTTPGRYRLALEVDSGNAIVEPDELNNIRFTDEIRIAEQRPDLRVDSVTHSGGAVAPGDEITVGVTVSNAGNLMAMANAQVVLSPNRVISTDDVVLDDRMLTLAPGQVDTASRTITLPSSITPGRYWLGAIVDTSDAVLELDEVNNAKATTDSITIGVGFVDVLTTTMPAAYLGVGYSVFLEASGGDGRYAWALAGGALPEGLTLVTGTGEIRGVSRTAGMAMFTVEAMSNGFTDTQALVIEARAIEGGLTIVTRELLPGIVGQAYPPLDPDAMQGAGQRIIAIGGAGNVSFTLVGAPPPGLTLEPDGLLTGVPTQTGGYQVGVMATDGTATATRSLPLTVVEPGRLILVAESLPNATIEQDYSHQLRVLGRSPTAQLMFRVTGGGTPAGLTLTESGLIVGLPTEIATATFAIEVMEVGPGAPTDTATFQLTVRSDDRLGITPSSLPEAKVGEVYESMLEARNGTAPFTWRVSATSGDLARGLRFEVEETGGVQRLKFLGTPEAVPSGGLSNMLVTLDDSVGRRSQLSVSIRVRDVLPTIKPTNSGSCTAHGPVDGEAPTALVLLLGLALVIRRRP